MGQSKRAKLDALFRHLARLGSGAVAWCRKAYAEGRSTPIRSGPTRKLAGMRGGNNADASTPVATQRFMLQRVRAGCGGMLTGAAGRPGSKPGIHSFELHGFKPQRAGTGRAVRIRNAGKISFSGAIPAGRVRNVRLARHPLGTGCDVRLAVQIPDGEAASRRKAVHRKTSRMARKHAANLVEKDWQVQGMAARDGSLRRGLDRSMREQSPGAFGRQGILPAHGPDAALPRQSVPPAPKPGQGIGHGHDAGSYAGA